MRSLTTLSALLIAAGMTTAAHAEGNKGYSSDQQSEQNQYSDSQQQEQQQPGSKQQGDQRQSASQQQGGEQQAADKSQVSGEKTKQMQRLLKERGYYEGNIDGIVGPQTRMALQQFQQERDIQATGTLNEATANALGLDVGQMQQVSGEDVETMASRASDRAISLNLLGQEQIRQLQQQLQAMNMYKGDVDGIVGPKTRSALQAYYREQMNLAAQGKIDPDSPLFQNLQEQEAEQVSGELSDEDWPHSPELEPFDQPE